MVAAAAATAAPIPLLAAAVAAVVPPIGGIKFHQPYTTNLLDYSVPRPV